MNGLARWILSGVAVLIVVGGISLASISFGESAQDQMMDVPRVDYRVTNCDRLWRSAGNSHLRFNEYNKVRPAIIKGEAAFISSTDDGVPYIGLNIEDGSICILYASPAERETQYAAHYNLKVGEGVSMACLGAHVDTNAVHVEQCGFTDGRDGAYHRVKSETYKQASHEKSEYRGDGTSRYCQQYDGC